MDLDISKYTVLQSGETGEPVNIDPRTVNSFQDLYKIIGTTIIQQAYFPEDHPLEEKVAVIVDEEGLLREDLQINFLASRLTIQHIVGVAVVLPLSAWQKLPYKTEEEE